MNFCFVVGRDLRDIFRWRILSMVWWRTDYRLENVSRYASGSAAEQLERFVFVVYLFGVVGFFIPFMWVAGRSLLRLLFLNFVVSSLIFSATESESSSLSLSPKLIIVLTADIVVPAGNNHYPFEIQLRPRLPTSYEGTHGYIRYFATLHIDRSAKKLHPLKETFTVINPLNLDNSPSYRVRLIFSLFF